MRLLILMAWSLASISVGLKARVLESPSNLTLTAQPDKMWQMTWDPILDDQLMGYDVFSRRGKDDFTKITKLPLTAAIFKFKGLDASRPVELVVAAEYEDGRSRPSNPVFSARARQARPAAAEAGGTDKGLQGPLSAGPTAQETPASRPAKPELGLEPSAAVTPYAQRSLRDRQTLLTPHRQWRACLGLEGQMIRYIVKGSDYVWNMPPVEDWWNYDPNITHNWEEYSLRLVFRVPVTVSYGVFPGFEASLTVPLDNEFVRKDRAIVDGNVYPIAPSIYPEMYTLALGDIQAGARIEILKEPPLVFGASLSLPTGVSRFKSFLDYIYLDKREAGNGMGVAQVTASLLYGNKGFKRGLHIEGSFTPGATENLMVDPGGYVVQNQAIHGDEMDLGGGYTLPWEEGRSSAVVGMMIHNIKAGKWIYADINQADYYDRQTTQPYLRALSGLNLYEDNQLEIYLEVNQDVSLMTLTGKLQFINRADGYTLGLSGGFVF